MPFNQARKLEHDEEPTGGAEEARQPILTIPPGDSAACFLVAKPARNNQPVCLECGRELAYGDYDMLYCPNPKCAC